MFPAVGLASILGEAQDRLSLTRESLSLVRGGWEAAGDLVVIREPKSPLLSRLDQDSKEIDGELMIAAIDG